MVISIITVLGQDKKSSPGLSNLINHGPHTCQSGLKVGRMKQKLGEFYDFPQNFDYKTHHINNCSGLIESKIIIQYFLLSLFH